MPHDTRRTLLVLGGSRDQLFLIRSAQELGLSVLCLDQDPRSPGFAEAEESAPVSTRDVAAILAHLARRAGPPVAGVITMGSDIPDVVSAVAEALGLSGPSRESARLATDKLAMKERFRACGVAIPWFAEVRSAEELRAHLARLGTLVVKPVDRSGSRGVFVLDARTPPELLAACFEEARGISFRGRVLVEEYLEGPQISTETVLWDGRAVTPGFADRNYELLERFRPQVMENGGFVPSTFRGHERRAVEELVERAARALGLERGTAKGDVVWTHDGPRVIEIAARLSGGDFCESLVPLASTGRLGQPHPRVNYVRAAIRIALGEEPDWDELEMPPEEAQKHVANRYFFPEPGRLVALEGVAAVRAQPWVKKLELGRAPGELVPPATSHAARFGVFVVVADDRESLERRIQWVYRTLRIETRHEEPARAA